MTVCLQVCAMTPWLRQQRNENLKPKQLFIPIALKELKVQAEKGSLYNWLQKMNRELRLGKWQQMLKIMFAPS